MDCMGCGSTAVSERSDLTAQGYGRYRCRNCGKQFNERSDSVLNRASLPSDIIAFVVFCRLRYRLTLRDLSEIMLLRGFTVSHECIRRWEAKMLPVMGDALRKRRHGSGRRSGKSWYTDETYLEGGTKVLPLGTISCRVRAGPSDNRRAQFLPTRGSLNSGPQCPPLDERVSE
jgi:transposase-like protein